MQIVKAQLDSIDDTWKQPRFDSLPHVVEVITSPNVPAAVERLRETRDAIEELVDGVVRIYHNGFNKAIHNYSQVGLEPLWKYYHSTSFLKLDYSSELEQIVCKSSIFWEIALHPRRDCRRPVNHLLVPLGLFNSLNCDTNFLLSQSSGKRKKCI